MPNSSNEEIEIVLYYLAQRLLSSSREAAPLHSEYVMTDLRVSFPLFIYLFSSPANCENAVSAALDQHLDAAVGELINASLAPQHQLETPSYVASMARDIVERIPLEKISSIARSDESDKIAATLNRSLKQRYHMDLRRGSDISHAYRESLSEPWHQTVHKGSLVSAIARYTRLTRAHESPDARDDGFPIVWCKAAGVFPNRTVKIGLAAINAEIARSRQLRRLEEVSRDSPCELLVVVTVGDTVGFENELHSVIMAKDVLWLSHEHTKALAISEEPQETFRKQILSSIPLTIVSPYKFHGPVDRDVFFGRQVEIRRILETRCANFTIVGARQIGKTSLLQAIQRHTDCTANEDNEIALYIDATTCRRVDQFCWSLFDAFASVFPDNVVQQLLECGATAGYEAFMDHLTGVIRRTRNKYILLIDEVDSILEDKEADLFEGFARTIANEHWVRFVFSGYRTLKARTSDRMSHLFNLCDQINLGPLNEHEAKDLVQQPMERIGVRFESGKTIKDILTSGSTVPWILQFFCDLLLQRLDMDGRRIVRNDDVSYVAGSDRFISKLCSIVEDRNMPVLEKLLIYSSITVDQSEMEEERIVARIRKLMFDVTFVEIREALNYLVDTYIFSRDRSRYRFVIPQLKAAIRRREGDCQLVVRSLADDYRTPQNKKRRRVGI